MILTIEVPKQLLSTFEPLPEIERGRYAIALMQAGQAVFEEAEDLEQMLPSLSESDYSILAESIADADAGRTIEGNTLFHKMRERSEARKHGTVP